MAVGPSSRHSDSDMNLSTTPFSSSVCDSGGSAVVGETSSSGGGGAATAAVVTTLKSIAMVIVMLAAISGNMLVIVSVFKFERLKITANSFIVSLACADLLVAVLVMPFSASQEIAGEWLFGRVACDIFNANDVLFSTASLLHLCCISTDRYIAITDPFRYERRMSRRRVALMLCMAWGASALLSHAPIHLGWYTTPSVQRRRHADVPTYGEIRSCEFVVNKVYCIVSSSISFWIPALVMVFTYCKIFREARRQEQRILRLHHATAVPLQPLQPLKQPEVDRNTTTHVHENGRNGNTDQRRFQQERKKMRREHKAAKTLGIIMGAFLVCWLPFFIWYIAHTLADACSTPALVVSTLFWVGYSNSALNPVIYASFNRDFRHAFQQLLFRHIPGCRANRQGACLRGQGRDDSLGGAGQSDSRGSNNETDRVLVPSNRTKGYYECVQ